MSRVGGTRRGDAGRWRRGTPGPAIGRARPVPMLTSGKVSYEIGGNVDATCFGGIAAVDRLVSKLDLVERIDHRLHLLKLHLPYHESDHVLNLT